MVGTGCSRVAGAGTPPAAAWAGGRQDSTLSAGPFRLPSEEGSWVGGWVTARGTDDLSCFSSLLAASLWRGLGLAWGRGCWIIFIAAL